MKIVDFKRIERKIINSKIPKPTIGNLAGHAAGEPFDEFVYSELKKIYPYTYRQYDYLNSLYRKNPECVSSEERKNLIRSKTLRHLLNRTDNNEKLEFRKSVFTKTG